MFILFTKLVEIVICLLENTRISNTYRGNIYKQFDKRKKILIYKKFINYKFKILYFFYLFMKFQFETSILNSIKLVFSYKSPIKEETTVKNSKLDLFSILISIKKQIYILFSISLFYFI